MGINLGSAAIADLKLGSTQVDKVYLGSTEVWSKGGGATEWGTVKYYSSFSVGYAANYADGCTVNSINAATLEAFIEEKGDMGEIYFTYDENQGGWDYAWMGEYIAPENMLATTGIDVTLDAGANYAEFMVEKTVIVDTTSPLTTANLAQGDLSSMNSSNTYSVNGATVPKNAIKEVIVGTLNTSTPSSFLAGAENLTNLDFTYAESLTSIGDNFLAYTPINFTLTLPDALTTIGAGFLFRTSFNQTLTIPNSVTSIGNNFLAYCASFNQPLTLSNSLTTIGQNFLMGCSVFNQSLILPDSLTSIGMGFLVNCYALTAPINLGTRPASITYGSSDDGNSFAVNNMSSPAYATGITIVGTYASDWKAKFPDKNSNFMYRKLIIGS